ncbi:hypothetical protein FDECE_12224 [Fusarium decemcellulare]|nr:hypothetical protein FDECE_12224 [Fusarium decemcellulare]
MPPSPKLPKRPHSDDGSDPNKRPCTDATPAPTPGPAPASLPSSPVTSAAMTSPPIPCEAQRAMFWLLMSGIMDDPEAMEGVCGPFEIQLPQQLDFEALVWGPGGSLFDAIQNNMLDEDMAIAWFCDNDGRPDKLIVGFSQQVEDADYANCVRLWRCFNQVWAWTRLVHEGITMPLLTYFHLCPTDDAHPYAILAVTPADRVFSGLNQELGIDEMDTAEDF